MCLGAVKGEWMSAAELIRPVTNAIFILVFVGVRSLSNPSPPQRAAGSSEPTAR